MTGRGEAEKDFVKVDVKIETNGESGCDSNDSVEVKKEPVATNDEGIEVIFTELEHESDNNNENYLDYIYTEASFLQSVSGVNSDLLGALIDIELKYDDFKKEDVKDDNDDQFVDLTSHSNGHFHKKCVNLGPITSETGYARVDETGSLLISQDDNQLQNDNKKRNACDKVYNCDTCGKSFAYRSTLDKHMITHTGEKPYPCNMCEKSFSNESNLKLHERIHTGVRPFHCPDCKSSFISSSNLKAHERIHTGVKPYSCDICERSFRSSSNLKQHKIIHTGEKPYSCDVCERSFVNAGNLKQHEMSHICKKYLSQGIQLNKKLYSCDVCEKLFRSSGNLRNHERVHTGERPYSCDRCDKLFRSASNLKQHERVHTGEKPYSCDVCEKSLTSLRNLKKHKLSHDRVESDGLLVPSISEKLKLIKKKSKLIKKKSKLMKKKSINSWVVNRNYSKRLNNAKASSAVESSPYSANNLSEQLCIPDNASNDSTEAGTAVESSTDQLDNEGIIITDNVSTTEPRQECTNPTTLRY